MDKISLLSIPDLTDSQKTILRRGNLRTIADLVCTPPRDLAKRCHVSPLEVTQLVQNVCQHQASLSFPFQTLENIDDNEEKAFTIGDAILDGAVGGGLRPGMIWEIVGESAAGKTQFALQASLYVQLAKARGGLSGSTCYLTTSTKLQTTRLVQIQQARGLSDASLEDVHTIPTPTVHILLTVLEKQLPMFIESIAKTPSRKPVKLLVIDALAELFHLVERVSTASLVERSQKINQISSLLHQLAERHHIAIVVLNEVVDSFDNYSVDSEKRERGLLLYSEQARWFNRGHSVFGENQKEASLGLVWANQVNARIMLSKTARRKYVEEEGAEADTAKRQRREEKGNGNGSRPSNTANEQEPSLIRRLTVVFNSAASPKSCDYIVTVAGVKGLPNEETTSRIHFSSPTRTTKVQSQSQSQSFSCTSPDPPQPQARVAPTDSSAQSQFPPQPQAPVLSQTIIPSSQAEEYDYFWTDDQTYDNIDWDNLEITLRESQQAAE